MSLRVGLSFRDSFTSPASSPESCNTSPEAEAKRPPMAERWVMCTAETAARSAHMELRLRQPPSALLMEQRGVEPRAHDFNIAALIQRTGGAYALYMRLSVPCMFFAMAASGTPVSFRTRLRHRGQTLRFPGTDPVLSGSDVSARLSSSECGRYSRRPHPCRR